MDIDEILLTPRETVSELDKYIVGQAEAKKLYLSLLGIDGEDKRFQAC